MRVSALLPIAVLVAAIPCLAQNTIRTVAGGGPPDGTVATSVAIGTVSSVAVDAQGTLYLASPETNRVFRMVAAGTASVFAGTGSRGYAGDGGSATAAALANPTAVLVDASGNVYISDSDNHVVRRVSSTGVITTFAGSGSQGFSGDGGPATSARLNRPRGLARDSQGNLYIADTWNNRIRKVTPAGTISTMAGTGTWSDPVDGILAVNSSLHGPEGIGMDSAGNLYITDTGVHRIRRVSPDGIIHAVAGTGTAGFFGDGGVPTAARLNSPTGVAPDADGSVYIADTGNHRIRRLVDGVIVTVAGSADVCSAGGDGGPPLQARLCSPGGVLPVAPGVYYIADTGNRRIRRVAQGVIAAVAGNGTFGFSGDFGPATSAQLNQPAGVVADSSGNFFIADGFNERVRRVAPDGTITSIGLAAAATAYTPVYPYGMAVDGAGNVYVSDWTYHVVLRITPGGLISTVAGTGTAGYSGDGSAATSAQLNFPSGLAMDGAGNLYIADRANHRIRRVSGGTITTVAGTGVRGFSGDNGPAISARLDTPAGLAVDASGNVYISDSYNNRIRKVSGGTITTIAGTGVAGYGGDGGPATSALLNAPWGIAVGAAGTLYVSDNANHRVRKIAPQGIITTVTGTGTAGFSGDLGAAHLATLNFPAWTALDLSGNLLISDGSNHRVRKVTFSPVSVSVGVSPSGRRIRVDGVDLTPETFAWVSGDVHTVSVDSPQAGTTGTRYVFSSWSDGGPQTQAFVVPHTSTSLTASFATQHLVAVTPQPSAGGSVVITPSSGDGYYNAGTSVQITAQPLPGYVFEGWTGSLAGSGSSPTITVTVSAPITATAVFTAVSCAATISPSPVTAASGGGQVAVNVTQHAACGQWTAASQASWVGVTAGAPAVGNSTVTLTVQPNTTGSVRSGSVTIANQTLTVNQMGCTYVVAPASASASATGGAGQVTVTTGASCTWSVSNAVPWVSFHGSGSGTGSGSAEFDVAANPNGTTRTAVATVAGQPVTINQEAAACRASLAPLATSAGPSAGTGTLTVSIPGGCTWQATSSATWISFPSGSTGTGGGTVSYSVEPNAGSATRVGTVVVAGATHTFTQAGQTCTFAINPGAGAAAAAGGASSLAVSATQGCAWSAVSDVPWITVTSGASGFGHGNVSYTVQANASAVARVGAMRVARRTFVLSQAGNATTLPSCAVSASPAVIRRGGLTELAGDLTLNCANVPSAGIPVTLNVTLSASVSSRLVSGQNVTEALALLNNPTVPALGVNASQGRLSGYNNLQFPLTLTPGTGGAASVRITNLRVNVSEAAQTGAVSALVQIRSASAVPVLNNQQTVATVVDSVAATRNVVPLNAAGQTVVAVVFRELMPLAFRPAAGEAGFLAPPIGVGVGSSDSGTRLRMTMSGVPAGVKVYAPVYPGGSQSAQLVNADSNGAGGGFLTGSALGGTHVQLSPFEGRATVTWEIRASDPAILETHTFPVVIEGANAEQLDLILRSVQFGLAPVSPVGLSSAAAPIPRFTDPNVAVRFVNLRLLPSTVVPGVALAAPKAVRAAVGSNYAFNYDLLNESSESASGTTVRGNAPPGFTISGCTAPGGNCTYSGSDVTFTYDSVAAGAGRTLSANVSSAGAIPNNTYAETVMSVAGAESDSDLGDNTASSGVLVQDCTPTLTPNWTSFPRAGGGATIQVRTACPEWWTSTSDAWVDIASGRFGGGDGSVTFSAEANVSGADRTGVIFVGGSPFLVNQAGGCTYSLSGSSGSLPVAGGSGTFTLTADCGWTASSSAAWLQVTPAGGASGTATLTYTAGANAGASRTATITVGGKTFTVTQAGPCTLSLSPATADVPFTGQKGTFTLTATGVGCAWTASSDRTWAQVGPPLSGTTGATLPYRVFPNFGTTQRTAVFNVGGQTFTITQAANPETAARRFVRMMYFGFLGRVPSEAEIVAQSVVPRESLVKGFLDAPEFKGGGRFAAALYIGLLQRDAEYGGWQFQRLTLADGGGQARMAQEYLASPEFLAKFGALSDTAFLDLIFRNLLNRPPTPDEVAFQLPYIQGTDGRGAFITAMVQIPEFDLTNLSRIRAFALYSALLMRDSTVAERNAVAGQIGTPEGLTNIIRAFLGSAEMNLLLQ